mgnify:CR=1 FL=1
MSTESNLFVSCLLISKLLGDGVSECELAPHNLIIPQNGVLSKSKVDDPVVVGVSVFRHDGSGELFLRLVVLSHTLGDGKGKNLSKEVALTVVGNR